MKEYELLKELKESSVIYQEDPDDPNNPEVLVKGVGRYRLKSLEKNVREKLEDLDERAQRTRSYEDWRQIAWMLDHHAMRAMVETIVSARKEIEGVKEAFLFGKSANNELLGKLERLGQLVKQRTEELEAAHAKIKELEEHVEQLEWQRNKKY